jgi:NAD(P)H-flavin reductase
VGLDITEFFNTQKRNSIPTTESTRKNTISTKKASATQGPEPEILRTSSLIDLQDSPLSPIDDRSISHDFNDIYDIRTHDHSRLARFILSPMAIGMIQKDRVESKKDLESAGDVVSKKGLLPAKKFELYTISSRQLANRTETNRVFKMRILLPKSMESLRLGVGQHIFLQFMNIKEEKMVQRAYTPISIQNEVGIDIYFKNYKGKMTSHLEKCSSIRMALPKNYDLQNPLMECSATGNKMWKRLGLIAGGTGLTLMLNIIGGYLKLNMDNLDSIVLINVNSSEEAVFGLKYLQELVSISRGKFRYVNLVSNPSSIASLEGYRVGKVTEELLQEFMPLPSEILTSCSMICGPPPFNSHCRRLLRDQLRHPEASVIHF